MSISVQAVCGVDTDEDERDEYSESGRAYCTPALGIMALKHEGNAAPERVEGSAVGPRNHASQAYLQEEEEVSHDTIPPDIDVEASVQPGEDVLPVASQVNPPPELLKRVRELENAQENVTTAIPMDFDEEHGKLRKRRWIIGVCVAIFVGVIVALVLGVMLGTRDSPVPAEPTESPTFTALKGMVESVWPHSGETLSDSSSPPYKALTWLANNMNLEAYVEWKRIQRYVLAVFYYSMNGDNWTIQGYWMSDDDECTWPTTSVETVCNNETQLLHLVLSGQNLAGSLPSELALLSNSLSKYNRHAT